MIVDSLEVEVQLESVVLQDPEVHLERGARDGAGARGEQGDKGGTGVVLANKGL